MVAKYKIEPLYFFKEGWWVFSPLFQSHLERKYLLLRIPSYLHQPPPSHGQVGELVSQDKQEDRQNRISEQIVLVCSYEPSQTNSCCCTGLRGDHFHPTCFCLSASLHPPNTDSLTL